jgi:hypothetical protein
MESTRAQAEQRINSVRQASEPSFADAAIRIMSGVAGGFGQMAKAGFGGATQEYAY